jgi:hypothetical protein
VKGTEMQRKKIINHPDFEFYWPEKVSSIGFLIATVIVALIIIATMLIAKIGA